MAYHQCFLHAMRNMDSSMPNTQLGPSTIQLNDADNVTVATCQMKLGELDGLVSLDAIPSGHKLALKAIAKGNSIIKYGQVIGTALAPSTYYDVSAKRLDVDRFSVRIGSDRSLPAQRSGLDMDSTPKVEQPSCLVRQR